MPRPRKPMPSGRATSRNCARCDISSEQVWCTVSTGAPESSNCPPGSSEIAPPPVTSNMPMMLPSSRIGSHPSRCCMPSSSERMLRRPSYGIGRWPSTVNGNFSCSVPMRNCAFGVTPSANHATRASRDSIGVMSIWSRAIKRADCGHEWSGIGKGPRPYTGPVRQGNHGRGERDMDAPGTWCRAGRNQPAGHNLAARALSKDHCS